MIKIVNLTPHPVIICRPGREPVTYPACAPADLPRAIENCEYPVDLDDPARIIGIGDLALTDAGSDGQGGYENAVSLQGTGLVDFIGYVGVEGLPEVSASDRMFGLDTFRIVSIVTALGALAAGRGIEDLLVPMGQIRDDRGRIVGAAGLAPATSLLTPLYRRITTPLHRATLRALEERNEARGGGVSDRAP